jgi:16S rRNA processing protein RimM
LSFKEENIIVLAKIGKPFGLKGFLKVHSYTNPPESLLSYPALFLQSKQDWVPCEFEATEPKTTHLRVKFAGVNTPEAAQAFTNLLIGAPRSQLSSPAATEYYWADLEGLTVMTRDQIILGKVLYLMNVGASDLMVVKGDQEHVIPFVLDEIVLKVDFDQKTILVNWNTEFQ